MTQMVKPLLREIFPVIFGNALQTGGSTIHHVKLLLFIISLFVIVRLHDCSLLNLSMHGGISNGNC